MTVPRSSPPPAPAWHAAFLAMLPTIRRHARFRFRRLDREAREEAVQEVVANALVAFVRLVERGRLDVAFPTPLARFAVAQYSVGRHVGGKLNTRDVLSPYAQHRRGVVVESIFRPKDDDQRPWMETLIEDPRTPVADQAAFRIDFPAWLDTLQPRDRRMAETMSVGVRPLDVAEMFQISPARVSQIRGQMALAWEQFHEGATKPSSEPAPAGCQAASRGE
ncbi:MAG: hypothetical protein KY475_20965 [Planctomycetes bacterium]|nr:hypothetical protein [Planctomycetota bacterium]